MDTFLTIVFVFVLILYFLPLIFRWIAPFIFKRLMNYFMKKAGGGMGFPPDFQQKKKEGEITIETNLPGQKTGNAHKPKGEYVDFEEVK